MDIFATEKFTPPGQEKKKEKSYEIKALSSLEYTKVVCNGSDKLQAFKGLEFDDVMMILDIGMVDSSQINTMLSDHLVFTAGRIFQKAILAENERKNS